MCDRERVGGSKKELFRRAPRERTHREEVIGTLPGSELLFKVIKAINLGSIPNSVQLLGIRKYTLDCFFVQLVQSLVFGVCRTSSASAS